MTFSIHPTEKGCNLRMSAIHVSSRLPLPILAEDALDLILAAFRSPEGKPRVELHGVIADRTPTGVRVHVVAKPGVFDLPWEHIARGIEVVA